MRLIIVRHGEPDYTHDCLTEIGHRQAKDTAERLKNEGIEAIYSSPFGRAKQTAQYTADKLGLPVQILDFMHEITWGNRDGTPLAANGHPWALADRLALEQYDLSRPDWREHPYYANNKAADEVDRVSAQIDAWLKTLGYERENLYYRCTLPDGRQRTVALFCHGGSSAAALSHILNIPFPYLCGALHLWFASVSVIRLDRHPGSLALPCLELINDGSHVPYGQE